MFGMYYGNMKEKIDQELKNFMAMEHEKVSTNPFLDYYFEELNNFLFSGGKRIRPILMVLAYGAIKPDDINAHIYRYSISIEFLHNASLIHDDIMDNARTRRGIPAFHYKFREYSEQNYPSTGINFDDYSLAMGILGGDYVYNLAYKTIHGDYFDPEICMNASLEFTSGFMDVVKGVVFETDLMAHFDVSEKQYIEMITGKTASLFRAAAKMGAIYAKGTEEQIEALASFATNVGIAFQLVDDIIGTFGDKSKTGKSIDSDIKEGKKTILLIKAIENADQEQKKILSNVVGNRNASPEDIEKVRRIMKETHALEYAKQKADSLYNSCKYFLEKPGLDFDDTYIDYLIGLAKLGIDREQ